MDEYRRLCELRAEHRVEVREPLVLVSQIQRSGGTLLSQLFDGHPECHAHPGELHLGHPHKLRWPRLDLREPPERWFESLYERKVERYLRKGYSKASRKLARGVDYDVLPFLFMPDLQRRLFLTAAQGAESEREVLDAYFTSFFNAWLDNQNLHRGPKRAVTAFAAAFATRGDEVERFFAAYPDGWLVAIVRDPKGWFESARRYKSSYDDLGTAIDTWVASTLALVEEKSRRPRVVLLSYEQLVREPDRVMCDLAERLGITFDETLLEPTFNGLPIRADSSEPVSSYGILEGRADSHRLSLSADERGQIDRRAGEAYEQALALVDRQPRNRRGCCLTRRSAS